MNRKLFLAGVTSIVLVGTLLLGSCADAIDDPGDSENVLVISQIFPSEVESDNAAPPALTSDVVQVKVQGILRNSADPDLNDVTLETYTVSYSPPLGTVPPVSSLTYAITATVPSGGTLTFPATAVNVIQKALGIADGVHTATITVAGRDVLTNPASASASFEITVADFDPLDTDADGVPDLADNCPTIPNPAQTDGDLDGVGLACDPDDTDPFVP